MPGHDSAVNNGLDSLSKGLPRESIDVDVTGVDWQLEASTNPAHLPEITRMDLHANSAASLLSGGAASPGRKTMKEYEQQQRNLEQENFQLKLRIYMLEERLPGGGAPDNDTNTIVDLKVQLATLRDELAQKKELLRHASDALESLEHQYGAELERQKQRAEDERLQLERRLEELQNALERANQERAALAERSAIEQPYLRAFEPLSVDHAACHSQHELGQLEAKMAELQDALGQMKQTAEERDQESELLRRQLAEARAAADRLPEQERRCHQLADELRQLRAQQERAAADTARLRAERERSGAEVEQLTQQLKQLEAEQESTGAELTRLRKQLQQAEQRPPAAEELQRTCDRLTAGRAADGARLVEMEEALQRATDRLKAAATNEATLTAALQSVGAQLVERKAELATAKKAQRRSEAHVKSLIEEQRKLHDTMKQYLATGDGGGGTEGAPADAAPAPAPAPAQTAAAAPSAETACVPSLCGGGAAPAPPLTPHEVQVYLLRTETQRKDRKIRTMVAEMKQMNDLLVKYRWEVKELAEEENERLWTELEENKKLIRELQDEKMELVLEKERQIQRLLAQLKERGAGAADGGSSPHPKAGSPHRAATDSSLQEVNSQVVALRSQLAHATLLVGERDSEIGRLRERLLQQRRLLDEPLPAPQLRQRLSRELGELCAELAAPRPGAPTAVELGGAGELGADSAQSAAAPSDPSEFGSEKAAGLRAQLADLRDQLLVKDRQLAEREESSADAERLRQALAERERQLAELAGAADRLRAAERQLAAADAQLQEMDELRDTLASRERELTLAEGQLNEIAELRDQLQTRDQQLAASGEHRRELLQTRQLLAERDQEKAALLRHLDQQRRQHECEARALRERIEQTVAAPTWQQYHEAEASHVREQAQLRRRLADTQSAAELLQRRLEQLADFLEMLLNLEERGVLDLSCLTAQHMAELQRSLLQSRELSQSLSQSLLLGGDGCEWSLDGSAALPLAEQSSLHVPELEPVRDQGPTVPTPAPRELGKAQRQSSVGGKAPGSLRVSPVGAAESEQSAAGQRVERPPAQEVETSDAEVQAGSVPNTAEQGTQAAARVETTEQTSQTSTKRAKTASQTSQTAQERAKTASQTSQTAQERAKTASQTSQTAQERAKTASQTSQTAQERAKTASQTVQTAAREVSTAERTVQTAEVTVRPAGEADRLEALAAQLAGRDAQLLQQTQLVAELRRQLERQLPQPLSPRTELGGGGDERAGGQLTARLPGDVRDRFRSLVQRQRTTDRASSTDTTGAGTAVERALSPLLSLARAQSAELMALDGRSQPPAAGPTRSAGQLPTAAVAAAPTPAAEQTPVPADASAAETAGPAPVPEKDVPVSASAAAAVAAVASESRESHGSHPKSQVTALIAEPTFSEPPPPPAPADWSESEAWSEPDRDVSLARIGLDQSSLGTRTESWLAQQSDSDAKRGRRRPRGGAGSQQAQELEAHIESLHQVKDALRAEVDIYRKVVPAGRQRPRHADAQTEPSGVLVPREVLTEIHSLQQQLERAIVANERIRRQLERELPPSPSAASELARKLEVTEQRLAESTDQLTASRARCDELRAKLSRAKDNLRLAQLNAEEFKDKFVRVSDDMVRLRERFTQMETDRERTSEESRRRRPRSPSADLVRRLERQLETAQAALQRQEQLSEELRQQLLQRPPPAATTGSCSESQLLEINREKLRLLGERAQLASRGRLLRSESCLLEGEAREVAAQRRLEAAKWAGWALERQQLQQEISALTERLAAAEAEAARRLLAEAERARLAEEHGQCQRRLAELSRAMQTDKRRLQEVSTQLEEVNAEMEAMRSKLNELDDGSPAESARVCLPPEPEPEPAEKDPEPEPAVRRSTSESDGPDVHQESDRTSAYSSPDLGIESDCYRGPQLRTASRPGRQQQQLAETAAGETEPTPADGSEAERLRQERDMMHSKLTATRAALQQALDKLSRADQRKARVERAIFRQLSKTHDILRRAKNNLAPPGAGAETAVAPQ
ncbi:CDK5 regulatory subunit-associated protein 2 [Amphibalanus amphitrite]|uniref:CDK5 regulatory subunit-associated protein 2 n=1 Tax=Amphibalanus amphitrite TaxID=1232801 RepID=A0A6A4VS56_AMPAM|nr:CDK5 regulatory subunit-associated protein 2 [Amphibalanus amphitrite]